MNGKIGFAILRNYCGIKIVAAAVVRQDLYKNYFSQCFSHLLTVLTDDSLKLSFFFIKSKSCFSEQIPYLILKSLKNMHFFCLVI